MVSKKNNLLFVSLAITVCHPSASLVMPFGDPRDGYFYPTLTLMMDSYILVHQRNVIWDINEIQNKILLEKYFIPSSIQL